jgi:hypothetical protein
MPAHVAALTAAGADRLPIRHFNAELGSSPCTSDDAHKKSSAAHRQIPRQNPCENDLQSQRLLHLYIENLLM